MSALRRALRVVCAGKDSIDRQDAAVEANAEITRDLHRATEEARKLALEEREAAKGAPVSSAR